MEQDLCLRSHWVSLECTLTNYVSRWCWRPSQSEGKTGTKMYDIGKEETHSY